MKLSTLSVVPGGGTPSSARTLLDASNGSDFGSLLSGMAKDASAEITPAASTSATPKAEATDLSSASAADALKPGESEDEATANQQRKRSPTEPQLHTVSDAAASSIAGLSGAAGINSLFTLAARAAEPSGRVVVPASSASGFTVVPASTQEHPGQVIAINDGTQASGRVDRRTPRLDDDDDRAKAAAGPVTPTPVAESIAASAMLTPANVPNAAHITQPSSGTDALTAEQPSKLGAGTRLAPLFTSVASTSTEDASDPSQAFTSAKPVKAAGEIENAPVPPASLSAVDAAVLPVTVRRETYLGFIRDAPVGGLATARAATDVLTTRTSDPSGSEGLQTRDMPHSPALVAPNASSPDADEAGASPSHPNDAGGTSTHGSDRFAAASAGDFGALDPLEVSQSISLSQAAPPALSLVPNKGGVAVGADLSVSRISASAQDRSAVVPLVLRADGAAIVADSSVSAITSLDTPFAGATPHPASLAPDADGRAVGAAGADPSSSMLLSPRSSPSHAKPLGTPLASGADGDVINEDRSGASRSATTVKVALASAKPIVSPSRESRADEPHQPTADATSSVPIVPVEAIAMPDVQAAPPVAQQVTDGIVGLAAAVPPEETAAGTQVAPARTLTLQLSPGGLGTLTVRLHVVGRALDVHLEASDVRTAALIDHDRDALAGALRDKDYQLQTLSVTTHDTTMPGGTHAERGAEPRTVVTGSTETGPLDRSRDDPAGGRSGNDGNSRQAPDQEPRPSRRPANDAPLERGGSSLFV